MSLATRGMSNAIPKTLSASKRARSQESKRSLNPSPVPKAPKVEEPVEETTALPPRFLRLGNEGRIFPRAQGHCRENALTH